jgi:hypothetical protein
MLLPAVVQNLVGTRRRGIRSTFNGSLRAERPESYSYRFPSLGFEVGRDSAAMIALLKLNWLQLAYNVNKPAPAHCARV